MIRTIFSSILFFTLASAVFAEGPLNSLAIAGDDTNHIQEQIKQAQKEVLSRGPGFVLIGKIERGSKTPYSINGEDFKVDADTKIYGDLRIGVGAEVSGIIRSGNNNVAEIVTIASSQESGSLVPSPDELKDH